MPKQFEDYSDDRHKAWCIHCGRNINSIDTNRDHVPSKSLLVKPYPDDVSTTEICEECNTSFSRDEEYFGALMSAILTGNTNPEDQTLEIGRRTFSRNESLRKRIDRSRKTFQTRDGQMKTTWDPEGDRVRNVIVKNARGHVFFEGGEAMLEPPVLVEIEPISELTPSAVDAFLGRGSNLAIWPEVGSRWMQRVLSDPNFDSDGFLIVQPDVYRFKLEVGAGIGIKSVVHEYLATSVFWE